MENPRYPSSRTAFSVFLDHCCSGKGGSAQVLHCSSSSWPMKVQGKCCHHGAVSLMDGSVLIRIRRHAVLTSSENILRSSSSSTESPNPLRSCLSPSRLDVVNQVAFRSPRISPPAESTDRHMLPSNRSRSLLMDESLKLSRPSTTRYLAFVGEC